MQAMLAASEFMLQEVIEIYKQAGLWEDTLLIYASDNGAPDETYHSNYPLAGFKKSLFEGAIRTPAFLYSPSYKILPHRGETDCYVHITDWYSTLVGVSRSPNASDEGHGHLDSIDQSRFLLRGNADWSCPRKEFLVHIDPVSKVAGYVKDQYKLLTGYYANTTAVSSAHCSNSTTVALNVSGIDLHHILLYNIILDPLETTDISAERPDEVNVLMTALLSFCDEETLLQCSIADAGDSRPNSEVAFVIPWVELETGERIDWF